VSNAVKLEPKKNFHQAKKSVLSVTKYIRKPDAIIVENLERGELIGVSTSAILVSH
jgi:hypothetical protein